jgi:ubiquinone/menaquinone biosynthesis C-methylase UbiE
MAPNIDDATVAGFGDEWQRFDQSKLPTEERDRLFDGYFNVFPWDDLPVDPEGFDLGCGSGRWAINVAPKVAILHCIDPSAAIDVAKVNLARFSNCVFHNASVDNIPVADRSMDFGYSLGVLHHIPDTGAALRQCVKKLKPGAPFLLYLYYSFENRPAWFRLVWKLSDVVRNAISILPHGLRYFFSQIIAMFVYWPLARFAALLGRASLNVSSFPLSSYRNASFYTMRTDALDRFGTRLEQRFSRAEIATMMRNAGLSRISFSDAEPYWCAVGYREDKAGDPT